MDNKVKTLFLGTPELAVPVLANLIKSHNFEIKGVITVPDQPQGRKQVLTPPPIKVFAQENNLPVLQPVKIDPAAIESIKKINPDILIVAAYGKILPKELLDIPNYGAINVHPSLLPKYRGPSPVQAAILNGDKKTGVTIMLMDTEIDHGPVLKSFEFPILNFETYESLAKKLFKLGAEKLPEVVIKYIQGKIKPRQQNHAQATYTQLIKKADGLIDWTKPAASIERMTRAYHPWPGAYTFLTNCQKQECQLKIIKAHSADSKQTTRESKIGLITKINNKIAVVCGDKQLLVIDKLQAPGKKIMTSQEYLNGHPDIIGQQFKQLTKLC